MPSYLCAVMTACSCMRVAHKTENASLIPRCMKTLERDLVWERKALERAIKKPHQFHPPWLPIIIAVSLLRSLEQTCRLPPVTGCRFHAQLSPPNANFSNVLFSYTSHTTTLGEPGTVTSFAIFLSPSLIPDAPIYICFVIVANVYISRQHT